MEILKSLPVKIIIAALLLIVLVFAIYKAKKVPLPISTSGVGDQANWNMKPQIHIFKVKGEKQFKTTIDNKQITFVPIAEFSAIGRLLAKNSYRNWLGKVNHAFELSYGWGLWAAQEYQDYIIVEPNVVDGYKYSYRKDAPREVRTLSFVDKCLIFPATENLYRALFHVKPRSLITLKGYLVNTAIDFPEGYIENYETRAELAEAKYLYLEQLTIDGVIYR